MDASSRSGRGEPPGRRRYDCIVPVKPVFIMEIIGHRGAAHDAPENTLASFRLGWEQGADAVELDVRLTRDGHALVIHDADTRRVTGVANRVAASTLAALRALDAGGWKGSRWAGEKLPTLAEALALIPEGKRLVIEIKCGPEILPELERVITASGKTAAQLLIISFHLEVCAAAKKMFPKIPVLLLSTLKHLPMTNRWTPRARGLIAKAVAARLDGLNIEGPAGLDAEFIRQVHAAGLKCVTWTVDQPDAAKNLRDAGIDALTTNRPGWLREQLR